MINLVPHGEVNPTSYTPGQVFGHFLPIGYLRCFVHGQFSISVLTRQFQRTNQIQCFGTIYFRICYSDYD